MCHVHVAGAQYEDSGVYMCSVPDVDLTRDIDFRVYRTSLKTFLRYNSVVACAVAKQWLLNGGYTGYIGYMLRS